MTKSGKYGDDTCPAKRLLVVSQHFWPENFRINDIVRSFTADGIEVDVLCGLPNYPKGEWFPGYRYTGPRREMYEDAQVYRAGEIRRKNNSSLRIFLNYCSFPFFALFNLFRLRRRNKQGKKYDAVFCYETSPVMMILPAIVYAKCHRLPLCTYVLDLWPDNLYSVLPVKNKLLRKIASGVSNWHYRRCDRLVAASDTLAERLRQVTAGAKRPPAIEVVPQYAEDFHAEAVTDAALAERFAGRFNILFTGNISPAQDLENLVRAVKLARQEADGQDIQVLILGDGMSREGLETYVQGEGLQDQFIFLGAVPPEEVPRYTGVADALFAGLAKSENLGLTLPAKIPTYLAAARPLLVADDGEGARVAGGCGAALVSPAGHSEKLAENILALRRMPRAARQKMGEAGRACYKAQFDRTTLLAKLRDFIFPEG